MSRVNSVFSASFFGLVLFALASTLPPSTAFAKHDNLTLRWEEFQNDPRAFMEKNPLKRDRLGQPVRSVENSKFSASDIRTKDYVVKKAKLRNEQIKNSNKNLKFSERFAAPSGSENLFDTAELTDKGITPIKSLFEMEEKGLRASTLTNPPWSGSYWPIYQGSLGARYAVDDFYSGRDGWKGFYDFAHTKAPLLKIYQSGDANAIKDLSPSEKYDLLLGDLTHREYKFESGYLTPAMWLEGERYYKERGKVEEWMGLCHGWAPASTEVPRPAKTVNTIAGDMKTPLTFYPSDIKGIVSYLWAKVPITSTFVGGRCNDKDPARDADTGRVTSENCFDTNPATWHYAIVNQIGLVKRAFVMDATYDYEVWNQPVFSYTYRYFNPQTGQSSEKIEDVLIAVETFTNDKFKKFRSKDTAFVIGIEMEVTYGVETGADHSETDSTDFDSYNSVTYMYDLELDKNKEMIGGEWYTNNHPDFAWLTSYKQKPLTAGDRALPAGSWKLGEPLPEFWKHIAVVTAVRLGEPLSVIVDALTEEAAQD